VIDFKEKVIGGRRKEENQIPPNQWYSGTESFKRRVLKSTSIKGLKGGKGEKEGRT